MIENDRLILRPFQKEDAKDLFKYLEKPLVNCFACMKIPTFEDAVTEAAEATEAVEATEAE